MAEFDVTLSAADTLQAEFSDSGIEEYATISADSTAFDADLDNSEDIGISIVPALSIDATFSEAINVDVDTPEYPGPYTVTPKSTSQTLWTSQQKMTAEVTVNAVPYSAVPNPQGGETVTIL